MPLSHATENTKLLSNGQINVSVTLETSNSTHATKDAVTKKIAKHEEDENYNKDERETLMNFILMAVLFSACHATVVSCLDLVSQQFYPMYRVSSEMVYMRNNQQYYLILKNLMMNS